MESLFLPYAALTVYVCVTLFFAIRGAMRTKSLASFAVGNRDIAPGWVGLSLTAQLTSVATFVVNPGLVYTYGLSALMGLGVAAGSGMTLGLILFSGRFRETGSRIQALTLPQWIGNCHKSPGLRLFAAVLSLCLLSFIVLIGVAIALTLAGLLRLESPTAIYTVVAAVIIFVFAYTLLGGANTSTYTNAIQAVVMLIVALLIIKSGAHLIFEGEGILCGLRKIAPELAGVTNSSSPYFRDIFEVFICNFLVGLAIVCQPHILGKALLLKDGSQIKTYLGVAFAAGSVFILIMIVGLYARVSLPEVISRSDTVVPIYIARHFSPAMLVLISMGLLCAGISTLEGILLALSSIFSNDIYPFIRPHKDGESAEEYAAKALRFGRISLCIIGLICIYMSISQIRNPVGGSVAIFAQYGIYLLFSVFFLPLGCGMFMPDISGKLVKAGVFMAVIGYFLPVLLKWPFYHNNPAFLAACSIVFSWLTVFIGRLFFKSSNQ
jgi:Na+/proline symporter